jgi:predicted ribosomally synthesized peptide with SipW-like signal peptide
MLAIALIISIAMYSSLAYFTDTDAITNTFTMGKIRISLEEPNWDGARGLGIYSGATLAKDPTVTAVEGACYMRIRMEVADGDGTPITDAGRISLILKTLYYDTAYGGEAPNIAPGKMYTSAGLQEQVASGAVHEEYNREAFAFAGTEAGNPAARYYNYIANGGVFDANKSPADTAVLFSAVVLPSDWGNTELLGLNADAYAISPGGVMEVTEPGTGYRICLRAEAVQSANLSGADEAFSILDSASGITREE